MQAWVSGTISWTWPQLLSLALMQAWVSGTISKRDNRPYSLLLTPYASLFLRGQQSLQIKLSGCNNAGPAISGLRSDEDTGPYRSNNNSKGIHQIETASTKQ